MLTTIYLRDKLMLWPTQPTAHRFAEDNTLDGVKPVITIGMNTSTALELLKLLSVPQKEHLVAGYPAFRNMPEEMWQRFYESNPNVPGSNRRHFSAFNHVRNDQFIACQITNREGRVQVWLEGMNTDDAPLIEIPQEFADLHVVERTVVLRSLPGTTIAFNQMFDHRLAQITYRQAIPAWISKGVLLNSLPADVDIEFLHGLGDDWSVKIEIAGRIYTQYYSAYNLADLAQVIMHAHGPMANVIEIKKVDE